MTFALLLLACWAAALALAALAAALAERHRERQRIPPLRSNHRDERKPHDHTDSEPKEAHRA